MMIVFDAFIEITTSEKFRYAHNEETPCKIQPSLRAYRRKRVMMRFDKDPWFTPIRMAVGFPLQIAKNSTKRSRIFVIQWHTLSSV